jgi:AcrR family transcriptional regulator
VNNIPSPKIGRPSTLSKQGILDTALALLESEGEKGLSMRKIARRLNVTPTSLYGYFSNRDSLLSALAEQFYDRVNLDLDFNAPYQQVVQNWLNQWRQQLHNAPEMMMLAGFMATTPRGLGELDKLAAALLPLTKNEAEAVCEAQSLLWTVISFCSFEQMASEESVMKHFKDALAIAEGSMAARHLAIGSNYDEMWRLTVARNMRGLSPRD